MSNNRQVYTADFGYGVLKSDTGTTPMAISETKSKDLSRGDIFFKDGKYYVFGERATEDAKMTSSFEYFENYLGNIALLDMKKAGIDFSEPICIKTGLTILDNKNGKVQRLAKILESLEYEGQKLKARVEILVQGQGILYDYFNQTGEDLSKSGRVIVIDLGTRSFDFIVFENGVADKSKSWADEIGLSTFIDTFKEYLQNISSDTSITNVEAMDSFVSGEFFSYGEKIDVSGKIEELKRKYVEKIAERLIENDRPMFNRAKKVIVAGGGAEIVSPDRLRGFDPQMFVHAVSPQTPLNMSNYRGYKNGFPKAK